MFFKKKCPICGAKNSKERTVCIECGAPFALGQVEGQLARVSTEGETQAKKQVEKAPKERAEDEYRENEKVLYKTSGWASLTHENPRKANLLVTEGHVVVEGEKPMKIPLSRIKHCRRAGYRTAELTFLDDQNQERWLSVDLGIGEELSFQRAIHRQLIGQLVGKFDEAAQPPGKSALGKVSAVKERFRDKTRDDMCVGLRRLGIDAKMAARGRIEEEMWGSGSLGIIHIPQGPIRWVNVLKTGDQQGNTYYYSAYGVPDPRLGPESPALYIRSVHKQTFPVFGRVVDVLWKGEDYGKGVIDRLNSDHQLKEPLMKRLDMKIRAIRDYGCWIISTGGRDVPSKELWNCYQSIAQHLLAEWST